MSGFDRHIEGEGEDETIFISIADLFSLLSLVVIIVALTMHPTRIATAGKPLLHAVTESTGQGVALNPQDTYVVLRTTGNSIVFTVYRGNARLADQSVKIEGDKTLMPEMWMRGVFKRYPPQRFIIVFLPRNENGMAIEALFTDTERLVQRLYPNQVRPALQ